MGRLGIGLETLQLLKSTLNSKCNFKVGRHKENFKRKRIRQIQ